MKCELTDKCSLKRPTIHNQIPSTGYAGLIFPSTAVATVILSIYEGTLTLL